MQGGLRLDDSVGGGIRILELRRGVRGRRGRLESSELLLVVLSIMNT